ncbi:MAG TPA: aminodeoxychorismate synthase component I, partial [Segetibacter sp.]
MTRVYNTFLVDDIAIIKQQMLSWCNRFNICCFLDNHHYSHALHSYECVAGAGCVHTFEPGKNFFPELSAFTARNNDWIFGHFSYDLKNKIETTLASSNPDKVDFPDYCLFVPEVVLQLSNEG